MNNIVPYQPFQPQQHQYPAAGITVTIDHGEATPVDDDGIEMQDDGSAVVNLVPRRRSRASNQPFDGNLAEDMADSDLDMIATTLIEAIEMDDRSRDGWLQSYEKAIDLLGTKIEDAATSGALGLTKSTIRAPLLLEACIRFQSNARGELLPVDGPVKVRIDDDETEDLRNAADDFERDFNHYLTTTATEYYPDFDRMLFHVAFAGCAFRKIYADPLRGRPVSESVYAPDLIVSQDITDLENAQRVTHRIQMRQSVMRRMQLAGVYRDIDLTQPMQINDPIGEKIKENMGLAAWSDRPEDQPYEVLECYTEWDLPGFEHKVRGDETGLPLPYQITIEKSSRQVLSIRRNWREGDELLRAVPRFVKYGMGSGLGFYDWGFSHILGNSSRTLTAIWRLLIDKGMFANFPGMIIKKGARTGTTSVRVGPGEAVEIEGEGKLSDFLMPLPYTDPSMVLFEFAQHIEESSRKLVGLADIQVGEGKQDAPVGTTIALIEQATKVINAVHKRMHQAQGQEFRILQELFAKNPRGLWKHNKSPAREWQAGEDFSNLDLVPASDPNVASQMQRVMRAQALVQLNMQAPNLLNPQEVLKITLDALGFGAMADRLIAPPQQPGQAPPDPKIAAAQMQAQGKQQQLQLQAQISAQEMQGNQQEQKFRLAHDLAESQDRRADRESRERIAALKFDSDKLKLQHDTMHKHLDRFTDSLHKHVDRQQQAYADAQQAETQALDQPPQGLEGFALGGRVLSLQHQQQAQPVVNVTVQRPRAVQTKKRVVFTFNQAGEVDGAEVVETPVEPETIEVVTDAG